MSLGEVFRCFGPEYVASRPGKIPTAHFKVMRAITQCRTPALGGHRHLCDDEECDYQHFVYHACRNRHCSLCQKRNQQQWLQARLKELLPIAYFHITFTLPSELNSLFMTHSKEAYSLFFKAASRTVLEFGRNNLGVQLGIVGILHTWGQKLNYHPHLHFIVTAGGISLDESRWIEANPKFLFPRAALQKVFKGKLLAFLRAASWLPKPEPLELKKAEAKTWGVKIQAPRSDPTPLLLYLARYTYRVAIDDKRIREIDTVAKTVTFTYRDYRDNGITKTLCLPALKFIALFLLHVLPKGFVKARYYGLFSHPTKKRLLPICNEHLRKDLQGKLTTLYCLQTLLATIQVPEPTSICPRCKKGRMRPVEVLRPIPGSDVFKPP